LIHDKKPQSNGDKIVQSTRLDSFAAPLYFLQSNRLRHVIAKITVHLKLGSGTELTSGRVYVESGIRGKASIKRTFLTLLIDPERKSSGLRT
jgi:hypothetical protein